jgi:hypothetical protein
MNSLAALFAGIRLDCVRGRYSYSTLLCATLYIMLNDAVGEDPATICAKDRTCVMKTVSHLIMEKMRQWTSLNQLTKSCLLRVYRETS